MNLAEFLIAALAAGAPSATAVEVTTVVSQTLERTLRLPGELLPFQRVSLHARVSGFVEEVAVDRGSRVRKGDLLVLLTAPEMTAQLAEAEARLRTVESQRAEAEARSVAAQSTFERLKTAAETPGTVAGNELLLAEKAMEAASAAAGAQASAVEAARAAVEALGDLQGYLRVTAPFDGIVTDRRVHPGALVGPAAGAAGGALLEIEQSSRLRLVVAVPEADFDGIATGVRVPFTVPAHPGRRFEGVVARIAHTLDPKTRTMSVELDLANPRGALAPGMYPEVEWAVKRTQPSLLVPRTSVVTTTERSFVVRVRDGRAEWVDVSRGAVYRDLVEVRGALAPGDTIVKRATDEIRENTALEISPAAK